MAKKDKGPRINNLYKFSGLLLADCGNTLKKEINMNKNNLNILIADDDQVDRYQIKRLLKQSDLICECTEVISVESAIKACDNAVFHCVIIDYQLPGQDGLDGIVLLHSKFPEIPIIMSTGQGNEIVAVEAMKRGASDYILKKNLSADLLKKSIINVIEKLQLEKKLKKLNMQLIEFARRAGMSEVAESVLHNIGNILNSTNVTLVSMKEKMISDRLLRLKEIANLLEVGVEKKKYIFSDEQGKLIPPYLSRLSDLLLSQQKEVVQELEKLDTHLQHITSIVLMQNEIAGFADISEKISTEELLKQAIQISGDVDAKNHVKITHRVQFKSDLLINRAKVLQILVSLLNNSKKALMLNLSPVPKKIEVEICRSLEKEFFEIRVSDNGIGIEKEAVNKIFSIKYMDKKIGQGFGLHMSAIAAREMNGKLMVESPGLNQGAVFTLFLPLTLCVDQGAHSL